MAQNGGRCRDAHHFGFTVIFAKTDGQVADGQGQGFQPQRFLVREAVILAFHPGVVNEGTSVRRQPTDRSADIRIHLDNLLNTVTMDHPKKSRCRKVKQVRPAGRPSLAVTNRKSTSFSP